MKRFIFLEIPHTESKKYHKLLQGNFPNKAIFSLNKKEGKTAESFKMLKPTERNQYRIIKGISHYGLHKLFKNQSNVKYITLLRDPIDRIISLYNSIKKNKNHSLHENVVKANMTLKMFVSSSLTRELSNYQTSIISGISFNLDKCNFDVYEEAKKNIDKHFAHVGIYHYYDDSVRELKKIIGADKSDEISYKGKQQQLKQSINSEVLDLIHERNIYDIILYNMFMTKYRDIEKELS